MGTPPKKVNANQSARYYLHPSALFVSESPVIVTTVLSTCVSVCLFDPVRKIGGINHYMLPLWNGDGLASPKFGNIANERLIQKMLALGCRKSNLQAKVFGGKSEGPGNVSLFRIGERNVEIAFAQLKEENIPIVSYSLKGNCGRQLQFHTDTGDVYVDFLNKPK